MNSFFSFRISKSIIGILIMGLFFGTSCQKKVEDVDAQNLRNMKLKNGATPNGLLEYYNFFSTQTQGEFKIRDYASTISVRGADLSGFFTDTQQKPISGGAVKIGNLTLAKSQSNVYESYYQPINEFYGKTNVFSLGLPNNTTLVDSIYVPKSLQLDIEPNISLGTMINWNTDAKNQKGVVIIAYYDPTFLYNSELQKNGYNKEILNVIDTQDIGTYKFDEKLLGDMPKGAVLKLLVGRANFKFMHDNDNKAYSIYAYSTVVDFFTFE